MGIAGASGSSQKKNTPETETMMLNEVRATPRLAPLTTLAETAVGLCAVLWFYTNTVTHAYIYIRIYTHTQSPPVSVFRSGAERASVVCNTHALCLC